MNTGKTLFSQLMDFLPWTTFTRVVERYGGDHRVRTLSCTEQYRAMAFAQLTYRESLRDIEICLSVQASKLYHMGFRQPVRRSTLADANERRDWRIYAALAQRLIVQAWSCVAKVESTYCNRRCSMGRGIKFTTEFKRETVRLALSSGRPRAEIAEDLGVGLSSLTRWIGQFRDEEMPPEIKDDLQAELKRLRKENAVLRQERDILKKAAAFFAKEGSR